MLRADYIRVPGNIWVKNPDERFTTIDMRGPLILVLYRLMEAINADLPKGFLLTEADVQAASTGLPMKALREAIVNALMHRSYREHRPTQIIRYDNRIEIINPGFSLKSEEKLGLPGSETRNPFIAAVFHDTNLAETKGSGIRAMRKLMQAAHLVPPTFESSRENNEFVSRLLLHHFLDAHDLEWLKQFERYGLSDNQKQALIFVREVGAIDNTTYRQMADCDILKASNDLRVLRSNNLLKSKGKGRATHYVAGDGLSAPVPEISAPVQEISAPAPEISAPAPEITALPDEIVFRIAQLNQREHDEEKVKRIIVDICSVRPMKAIEIASFLNKGERYVKRKYLSKMIVEKKLKYLHPEMISHPEQAYLINNCF
jgi:ATP-dependent DNA helicase RecG